MAGALPLSSDLAHPVRALAEVGLRPAAPFLHTGSEDPAPKPLDPGWICGLVLASAAGLFVVTLGHGAGLREHPWTLEIYWSGVVLMLAPLALRLCWPDVARAERLCLLVVLAEVLVLYRIVYYPLNIVHHDEILHWIASDDILAARRLFLSNPLLPVGPTYPALEILATGLTNVTGLPIYGSALLLLAALKAIFLTSLFFLLERLTHSGRVAGIGCLVYVGSPTFTWFNTAFSYESLGVALCALAFAAEAVAEDQDRSQRRRWLLLLILLLATLAVTHHLSAAFGAIYFGGLALVESLRRRDGRRRGTRAAILVAGLGAVALPVLWMQIRGTPVQNYLGPIIEQGFNALLNKLQGVKLYAVEGPTTAAPQPIGIRLTTLLGTALIALCLATGFFRTLVMSTAARDGWAAIRALLGRCWRDSRLVFLALIALFYPVSVALRLSIGGWEVGNRMSTFVFFAVALLAGVSVAHVWQGRTPNRRRALLTSVMVTIIAMSGVTSAALTPIRGPYQVEADAQSVEFMGVQTAGWTKEWLGPGNRFVADRINRLLLAGYGRQDVRTDVAPGISSWRLFLSEQVYSDEEHALASGSVDFMLADLRLTTNTPLMGHYFEPWEANDGTPITADQLLKYNDIKNVARIYDNGYIVIYDVRGLHER
ncbi:hypothetical protein GU700_01135 [Methylobacterium sp. NI91]|nr:MULTISPECIES: hypothetical protein [unclassified Methylobacterium]QIJ73323.1 hypothetical protein CLZ_01135 [Methylobacterium sp. CLZ]QIJ78227.1 hypothetical protein GU700_01135 [Methylobacterium sp. NI91]